MPTPAAGMAVRQDSVIMFPLFRSMRVVRRAGFAFLTAWAAAAAWAQTPSEGVEEPRLLDRLVVEGRATDLVGVAGAASEGSVGYRELAARPFLRRGELLEVIPGVVITQHSGGGKANQYFLRGFNLDHGTDFALSVDGVPVNMRSHAHGQGYADLNFMIPELVKSVDYRKGPFFAEVGDFSAAGAAEFSLFDELPAGLAKVELGKSGYARVVLAETFRNVGSAKGRREGGMSATTLGFEATHDDGPWELEENLRRYSAMARHVWGGEDRRFSVTALGYAARWDSTDQIPLRAVEAGALGRFGNVDGSDGGESERVSVAFDGVVKAGAGTTRVNAYAMYYRLNLFSNFTYFLDDAENGDQFNQRDRRFVFGGAATHAWTTELGGRRLEMKAGVQARDDVIMEVGLHHSAERRRIGTTRDDNVNEVSAGVFASGTLHVSELVRVQAGLRADGYYFDVGSDTAANSGRRTAGIVSPKLGVVLSPWEKAEVYVNAGFGFHSNDARGTVIAVDPSTGDRAERVNPLVRSKGAEIGLRTSAVSGLTSTVSVWVLGLDSELVFVGDAGGTEASGASRRYGVEWANFYRATSWLSLDADLALTRARYRDAAVGAAGVAEDRIANSIDRVVTAGVTAELPGGWLGSVRLRYFGPQPLIEDNSVRAPSSTSVNARLGWRGRDWEFAVDVLNALDRKNYDIAYFYGSRLRGEVDAGVDDLHFHPAEPRTVRVSVGRKF